MLDNPDKVAPAVSEVCEYITLSVAGQWFCVPSSFIQEIRQWSPVTYLPGSSEHVFGAINLRGTVMPIVDLAAVLGFEPQSPQERNAVIIIKHGTKMCGYLVSNASKLVKVNADEIQPPPEIEEHASGKLCSGTLFLGEQMVQVLAIENLFPFNKAGVIE